MVGFGRSGNTLLRLMLDSHPELAIPPETDFIPPITIACGLSFRPADAFVATLVEHWRLRDLQVDAGRIERAVRRLRPFDLGEALRIVYRTYAAKFGKTRWGDKSPGYLPVMPLIAHVLPEARFVHVIRDGRDAWLSIRDLWFGPDTIEEAAESWQRWIVDARRAAKLLPSYAEVRFERLVSDPEGTLRDLCAYLELPWDDAMLRYYERAPQRIAEVITEASDGERVVASVAQRHRIHALTAQPPIASRIGRWHRELPAEDVATFEAIAGETLAELGYELSNAVPN